ncbi:hypothetical protein PTTG_28602 [Puccinia triticina 1-1 BBBD Race 1]|uniref:Nucleotide exchange factor SIL1 n=1 Tax=Puccinia triticina (isolate 1-1 / race 1 (BBBD)) TaxID=630390 RepID=A0A180GCM7_PUCT1|nr:hypothetical protein PTTG_28602 [Puccinia triticina 1-1 BBBD Race 1]
MLLTKILVSLQLLYYYRVAAHPLSLTHSLAKRAESSTLEATHIPHVHERGEAESLNSAGEFERLSLDKHVEEAEKNISHLEFKNEEPVENFLDEKFKALEVGDLHETNMQKLLLAIEEANLEDIDNEKPYWEKLQGLIAGLSKINEPLEEILSEKIIPELSDPKDILKFEEELYNQKCKAVEKSLTNLQKDMLQKTVGLFQEYPIDPEGSERGQIDEVIVENQKENEDKNYPVKFAKSIGPALAEMSKRGLFFGFLQMTAQSAKMDAKTQAKLAHMVHEILAILPTSSDARAAFLEALQFRDLMFFKTGGFKYIPQSLLSKPLTTEQHKLLQAFGNLIPTEKDFDGPHSY